MVLDRKVKIPHCFKLLALFHLYYHALFHSYHPALTAMFPVVCVMATAGSCWAKPACRDVSCSRNLKSCGEPRQRVTACS